MLHKIGIEEHFAIPETMGNTLQYFDKSVQEFNKQRILDLMDYRIKDMDENGMDMMILSLNSPGLQEIPDKKEVVNVARKANDHLAEAIAKRSDRYRGFAALPMQDPDAAIEEMYRVTKELGFVGILVNGYSQIDTPENYKYLDDPMYRTFWKEVEKLDVPFYLHPREPMPCNSGSYDGHYWLMGAAWAFGVETATHALRLMCSGLFDECPKLKLVLGHLGEGLPFTIWRTQNRFDKRNRGMPAKRSMLEYMSKNVWYTTSGQFRTSALWGTMMEFGSDHILFATDFPFEEVSDACKWFDACSISENDRKKIGRDNCVSLFKLTDL